MLEHTAGRVERIGRERVAQRPLSAKAPIRHIDTTLIVLSLTLAAFGALMVYSATFARLSADGFPPGFFLSRQVVFAVLGVVAMAAGAAVPYRRLKAWAPLVYTVSLIGLGLVLTPMGSRAAGAQRWINMGFFQFQPSEFAKIAAIVALAAVLSNRRGEAGPLDALKGVILVVVPGVLIYTQPDLGTLLVLLAILGGMLLVAGTRVRLLLAIAVLGAFAFWGILHVGLLKDYQVARLSAFLDPRSDPLRTGYNLSQAKIAVGSGGITGKGLLGGTQTNLDFVPEQHTDFIFTAVGEELGFVGAALFLLAFAAFLWRGIRIALISKDVFGSMLAAGIVAMLAFQMFINVGMTMGISPITGIPLPFMSYGGSSLVTTFLATGILLNVHMRRL